MFPADARTLSGDLASPQHLAELRVPGAGLNLPAPAADAGEPAHLLLLALQGRVACFHHGLAWHLEPRHFAWLVPSAALTLRPATLRAGEVLAWRFSPAALPPGFRPLLPRPAQPARGPVHGPSPLTPSMQTLLLALRGCPVSPALRTLWGTGKLIELLTLLMPSPAAVAESPAAPVAAPAPRILHPAIRAALDYMGAHLAEPIGLPEISAAAHASPSHLSRLFTAEMGHGPTQHLRRLRLEHAASLLRSGQTNVTEAALAAGYASLGQFSRAFSEHHGRSPSSVLRGQSA